uniref:Uncharacterized protein n=1 Tax=Morchella importuna TaxID=1174673 RepID=A0A650AG54_9PEZI|nr:hypothetical protein [Morchella importuna]QGN66649.1 hypothetical protein [Morchella importuna]
MKINGEEGYIKDKYYPLYFPSIAGAMQCTRPLSNSPLMAFGQERSYFFVFIIFIVCLRRSPRGGAAHFVSSTPWVGSLPTAPYPGRVRVCAEAAGDSLIYFHPPSPAPPLSRTAFSHGLRPREKFFFKERGEGF